MKENILYIWLQQALGLYNRLASEIFPRFGSIGEIYACDDFSFLGENRERYITALENKDVSSAFEVMKKCEARGIRIVGYYDELYPLRLRRIKMPPVALYSIGEWRDLNNTPCIGIVGTRDMSENGRDITEKFAYQLSKSGAFIISGLAKGIDTCAHRGAVMADGYTVAVLGNPIGTVYPRENEKAFETLYKRGLVVSELYPGAPRTRADFPNRNRIISALSNSVIISEAGESSGALITAKHAIEQGIPIFAIPGAVGAATAGTNSLIKKGVPAVTDPFDVISAMKLDFPSELHNYEPAITENLLGYGSRIVRDPNKPKPTDKPKKPIEASSKPKEIPTSVEPIYDDSPIEYDLDGDPKPKIPINLSDMIYAELCKGKALSADDLVRILKIPVTSILGELTLLELEGRVTVSIGSRFSAVID